MRDWTAADQAAYKLCLRERLEPPTQKVPVTLGPGRTDSEDNRRWFVMARDPATGRYLELDVGVLLDGSGRKEQYPDGIIRSVPEAKRIAEQIVAALNAQGGIAL